MRTSPNGRRVVPRLLCTLAVLAVGCSGNPGPGDSTAVEPEARATPAADSLQPPGAASSSIPLGYMPAPGTCRVWVPGEPPAEQANRYPVGRCSTLRTSLPEDAWLLYRPPDDSGLVRAWQYDEGGQVRAQRLYDLSTGRLIRHIAPASGN